MYTYIARYCLCQGRKAAPSCAPGASSPRWKDTMVSYSLSMDPAMVLFKAFSAECKLLRSVDVSCLYSLRSQRGLQV